MISKHIFHFCNNLCTENVVQLRNDDPNRLCPVLQIQGEKLDAFSKVRGWKAAKRTMLKAIEKDLNDRFADVREDMVLGMAYTCSKEEAQEWKQEIAEKFPEYEIVEGPLSLSVACHIGPGAMAVTCMKKVR